MLKAYSSSDDERVNRAMNALRAKAAIICAERNYKFIEDEEITNVLEILANWLIGNTRKWIFLKGEFGTSKTTMAKTAFQALTENLKRQGFEDYMLPVFITAKTLVELVEDKKKEQFKNYIRRPFLFVDDLGREMLDVNVWGNIKNPILDMFEHRYDANLPTLITTNLNIEEIKEKYDKINIALDPKGNGWLYSRLKEMAIRIEFQKDDYRGTQN